MKTRNDVTDYQITTPRRLIRDLPLSEQPITRFCFAGSKAISNAELIASILQTEDALDLAYDVLHMVDGELHRLPTITRQQLMGLPGIDQAQAVRLQTAIELGCRILQVRANEKPLVTSPIDAANLLMTEMMLLEQEQMRLILLDTRNRVLAIPIIYVGSLNSCVVRIGELFRMVLRYCAAAMIVVHNHPSGEAKASPEDVSATREIVKAGELLNIPILDHIIIGRNEWISLKSLGLGFD